MKLQLDTENKTIRLESDVVLSKLIETLNKLLPNKEWKKFTLQTNTTITHWSSPIIIEKYIRPYQPTFPWQPWYYSSNHNNVMMANKVTTEMKTSQNALELKSGVFNVQV